MKTTAVPIAILALTVAASAAPVQPASVLARSTESPTAADKVLDGVTSAVHTILLRDVGTKSKRQPAFSVDTDRGDDHGFELERRGILHHLLKGTLNLYREIKDMRSHRRRDSSLDAEPLEQRGFGRHAGNLMGHLGTVSDVASLGQSVWGMIHRRDLDERDVPEPAGINELEQRGFGHHAGNLMGHIGTVSDVASLGQSVWGMIHRRDLDERDVPEPAGINELEQRGFGHHAGNLMGHIGTVSNVASLGQSVWGMIHRRDLDERDVPEPAGINELEQRGFGHHAGNLMGHIGTVSNVASLGQSVWGMIHPRDLDVDDE